MSMQEKTVKIFNFPVIKIFKNELKQRVVKDDV